MEYDMRDADSMHDYSVQDAEMQTEPEHESSRRDTDRTAESDLFKNHIKSFSKETE
jgi:hypothetical protein